MVTGVKGLFVLLLVEVLSAVFKLLKFLLAISSNVNEVLFEVAGFVRMGVEPTFELSNISELKSIFRVPNPPEESWCELLNI